MSPQRIQRQRTKGWRMPEDAVYVGRPSKWGNPYSFTIRPDGVVTQWGPRGQHASFPPSDPDRVLRSRRLCVVLFEDIVVEQWWDLSPLAGRDLACWCPLDQPCHADVLLRLANTPDT